MTPIRSSFLVRLGTAVLLAAGAATSAQAADATPKSGTAYQAERRNCESGNTQQDKATCLREAGAAAEERKRNGLTNEGTPKANAADRCQGLPAAERTDCMARVKGPQKAGQTVTTSGSVAGGGTLTETRTVTVGKPVVVPAASAASRP